MGITRTEDRLRRFDALIDLNYAARVAGFRGVSNDHSRWTESASLEDIETLRGQRLEFARKLLAERAAPIAGCTPHNGESACSLALVCQRCHRCLLHCTCPPPDQRADKIDGLTEAFVHQFCTRKIRSGQSSR